MICATCQGKGEDYVQSTAEVIPCPSCYGTGFGPQEDWWFNEELVGHDKWLEEVLKMSKPTLKMSALGRVVANIIGCTFGGLHHLSYNALTHRRVKWDATGHIVIMFDTTMATIDDSRLTKLVVLCHDQAIRLEINAAGHRYFKLLFHPRYSRERIHEFYNHPTIEEQIERYRTSYEVFRAAGHVEEEEES